MGMVQHLIWVDYVLIAICLIFCIRGLYLGFARELLNLILWFVVFTVPAYCSESLSGLLSLWIKSPGARMTLSFIALMILTWGLGAVLRLFVCKSIEFAGLSIPNRILGGVLGFAKGLVFVFIIIWLLSYTTVLKSKFWDNSYFLPKLDHVSHALWQVNWQDKFNQIKLKAQKAAESQKDKGDLF